MSIKPERTKVHKVMDDSAEANADLSSMHQRMVRLTGASSGDAKAAAPTGQGAEVYGSLLNAPIEGAMAEIQVSGIAEVQVNGAVDAGKELTVGGTDGRLEAAASGDYVCARGREAGLKANHCISVTLCGYYKP